MDYGYTVKDVIKKSFYGIQNVFTDDYFVCTVLNCYKLRSTFHPPTSNIIGSLKRNQFLKLYFSKISHEIKIAKLLYHLLPFLIK